MPPVGFQLELKQPQLETSSRSFSLPVLVCCNCLSLPVLSTQAFCFRHSNIINVTFFSVLYSTTMSGLLWWIAWSVWILKSHNILTLLFSTTLAGLWLYYLTSPTKPNFRYSSKCTTFAIFSYLCLYSLWTSILPSAIKWVVESSLSPRILHFSDTCWPSMFSYPVHS